MRRVGDIDSIQAEGRFPAIDGWLVLEAGAHTGLG